MSKNKSNKRDDELMMANQLLRAKIQLISEGRFSAMHGNETMTPRMENIFLSNILRFEEAKSLSKEIPIYELIGKPDYIREEELSDDDLIGEMIRLEKFMEEHGVVCDSLCAVDDRVYYRFLTEELFVQPVSDMKLPGLTAFFIYEEFHPNDEYDTTKMLEAFMKIFLTNSFDVSTIMLDEEFFTNLEQVRFFRNLFAEIADLKFEKESFEIKDEYAEILFSCSFEAFTHPGQTGITYKGEGRIRFLKAYGCWCYEEVQLPGMV